MEGWQEVFEAVALYSLAGVRWALTVLICFAKVAQTGKSKELVLPTCPHNDFVK